MWLSHIEPHHERYTEHGAKDTIRQRSRYIEKATGN